MGLRCCALLKFNQLNIQIMRKVVLVLVAIATFSCSIDADRSEDSKENCGIVTDKFTRAGAFVIELDGYKEIFLQEFKWNQINTDQKYCN